MSLGFFVWVMKLGNNPTEYILVWKCYKVREAFLTCQTLGSRSTEDRMLV
jgi:hypothetical protein